MASMRASPKNILVTHRSYEKIITAYNEELKRDGKVNNLDFFRRVVEPEIPGYKSQSWYQFLKRYKTNVGIMAAFVPSAAVPVPTADEALATTMMTNNVATAKLVSSLLNISADAAADILANPHLITPEKRIELGIKIMKAQDSRIHAVGKLREDTREQEKFDRAFESANFG